MSQSHTENRSVLPETIKQKLADYLLQSDPDCVIGIGIRIYMQQPDRWEELVAELRHLSKVNPDYMTGVIGPKAVAILVHS